MTHEVYLPNVNQQFVDANGMLTEVGYRFLYFLWERSGGHDDSITALQNESFFWATPTSFFTDITVVSTGTAYTTQGNTLLIATAAITITLNPNPIDQEKVTIKRAVPTGLVTVSGGSKNIDDMTTYEIPTDYEAVQIVYSITDDNWFIV